MEPECTDNPIKEFISLSSKCYSYICKNDIEDNKNKLKNNIVHSKGISNSYENKYIDFIYRFCFTCSRLRCTFLSSPKLVYIGELYFSVILFSALPNLFT